MSAVCGPHLQTSFAEEVDQTPARRAFGGVCGGRGCRVRPIEAGTKATVVIAVVAVVSDLGLRPIEAGTKATVVIVVVADLGFRPIEAGTKATVVVAVVDEGDGGRGGGRRRRRSRWWTKTALVGDGEKEKWGLRRGKKTWEELGPCLRQEEVRKTFFNEMSSEKQTICRGQSSSRVCAAQT
ncbi:hypothetical protein E3N88_41158 [Mikania micrantha]|uniref:Uncharacterized protein n=1 Tax=Mikania micrantha TaxID=192012 RepID=A0A5N6LQM6_9ASTR|nr:hypothetical protein E3N88_41158 [Mikania micrantha]